MDAGVHLDWQRMACDHHNDHLHGGLISFPGTPTGTSVLAAVIAGSTLLNTLLKLAFQRARPTIHRIIEASGYSFPSGHSMAAFSLYGGLAFLIWKHIPTAIGRVLMIIVSAAFILTIGMSRIYLGVHYPSDVIGGYFLSGSWLAICIWFYQRYAERLSLLRSKPLT